MAETLELSQLTGYRTGGTVHVVVNNQLGFTTAPESARSSLYPTDVAKMVQAPVFHVNGDDPEACMRAARLAFGFRQAFHKDVVIDLVCYRRHGHNEGDDPSYTQPRMYAIIDNKRSVRKLYTESLVRRGDITVEEAEKALEDFQARLQVALDETRQTSPPRPTTLPSPPAPPTSGPAVPTGVGRDELERLATEASAVPAGFTVHPKLLRQFDQRARMLAGGEVDWALGEALAFGSVLLEGTDVRLSGQDTRRGTFSQRHAVLVDYHTGEEWVPLAHLVGEGVGQFGVHDSLLSEYAAVGFEYGYSVESPDALVAWEAQFGDFANGAQIIIDNFFVSADDKWGQRSGLVLLLPHGYEGQGPEHSSARIERFLTLSARDNMRLAQPTTAAQYFHLLRSQVRGLGRRQPLVVFTPKSLLRARQSRSALDDLTVGSFAEVLDDPAATGARRAGRRRAAPTRPRCRTAGAAVLGQGGLRPRDPSRGAARGGRRAPRPGRRAGRGGRGADRAALSLARGGTVGGARPLPAGRSGGVGARGAREHGGVVLRARAAASPAPGALRAQPCEPGRVGQPRHGERRPAPPRAGGPPAARLFLTPGARPRRLTLGPIPVPRLRGLGARPRCQRREMPRTSSSSSSAPEVSATLIVTMPRARAGFRLTPRSSRNTAWCGVTPSASQAMR